MQRPYAPFRHNIDGADHARAFRVTDAGTNNVSVAAGRVRIDQTVTNFATATALGPLANGTHFIYIDNLGAITSNLGGPYPANSIPLARVVVAAGDVTGITDDRTPAAALDTGAGGGPHNFLSATHPDTLAAAVVDGDIAIGNVTPRWSRLAIAVPAANVRNVLGVDNAELRPSWKAALDGVNPANIAAAAAPGTSLIFSHRDHIHAHPGALGANLHHNQAHAAAQHNAAVLTAGFNENLGAFYMDVSQIGAPANPGAGIRRLFVDNATGEISVRTNAGVTVSLEGAGGGGTLDAAYDFGGAGAGRTINATDGAVLITNPDADPGVPNLELARAAAYVAEPFLGIRATGDAAYRFLADGNGDMSWGSGAGAADVVLSRAAANHLALAAGDRFRVQYIADTAGTDRITTAAAGIQVTIAGQTAITGRLGIRGNPAADDSIIVNLQPTIIDAVGIFPAVLYINPTITSSAFFNLAYAVQGIITGRMSGGVTLYCYGLVYAANPTSFSSHVNTCPEAIAVVGSWNATRSAGTLDVTEAVAFKATTPTLTGTLADINVTRSYGMWILNQGHSRVATSYGIYMAAQSGSSAASYGLYIENATDYAIFVDAGLARFDGDGVDVFELPADATDPTGGGGAALGRVPCSIGGVTRYLAYY